MNVYVHRGNVHPHLDILRIPVSIDQGISIETDVHIVGMYTPISSKYELKCSRLHLHLVEVDAGLEV